MTLAKHCHSKIPQPGRKVPGTALVLDGDEVKLRLEAERTATKTPVHVDWLRFTCALRNVIPFGVFSGKPSRRQEDHLPAYKSEAYEWLSAPAQELVLKKLIESNANEHIDHTFRAIFSQVSDLANEVCEALGPDFIPANEIKRGRDFYKHLLPINRNGSECGWIGFMSDSTAANNAQASTIHVNLYGAACTFAAPGWSERMADVVDMHQAKITRADLALDFFDGYPGGLDAIKQDFDDGLCHSGGRRLRCNMVGDWSAAPQDGRSFYWGSKEAGKQTNAYEKGHQLFGFEYGSQWLRIELRYGNKLRVLESDILRRPADFFAGASDWHALALSKADAIVTPQAVPTKTQLAVMSIQAEVHRTLQWANNIAGPTFAMLVKFATEGQLWEVTEHKKLPGRMQKFSESEIAQAFKKAMGRFSTAEHLPSALMAA